MKNIKLAVGLVVAAVVLASCSPQKEPVVNNEAPKKVAVNAKESIAWLHSYGAGTQKAREDKKLVMLKFTAPW